MGLTFYRENTVWPYVHATTNAAVYYASRNILLCLALMLAYELFEWGVLAQISDEWAENTDDSLIGDPLIGATSIFAYWLIDQRTGWNADFRATVPRWVRWVAPLTTGVVSSVIAINNDESSWSVVLIGVLYIAISAAFYTPYAYRVGAPPGVRHNLIVWLYLTGVLTGLAAPRIDYPLNTFLRVLFFNTTLLFAALAAILMDIYYYTMVPMRPPPD